MNNIKIYESERFGEVRTFLDTNGEAWFCLVDVCRALNIINSSDIHSRIDKDGVDLAEVIDRMGRTQKATFINEPNLYLTIFRSDKPEAKLFQNWVCKEVLPSIRKTGAYGVREGVTEKELLEMRLFAVREAKSLMNMDEASVAGMLNPILSEIGVKAIDYVDSNGAVKCATVLLREHGINISVRKFNERMQGRGFLSRMCRNSTGGKEKHFQCLTEKGLRWGKNMVSPQNQKETQPMYYVDKFIDLLNTLKI